MLVWDSMKTPNYFGVAMFCDQCGLFFADNAALFLLHSRLMHFWYEDRAKGKRLATDGIVILAWMDYLENSSDTAVIYVMYLDTVFILPQSPLIALMIAYTAIVKAGDETVHPYHDTNVVNSIAVKYKSMSWKQV